MKTLQHYAPTAARLLLGVLFTVFGLNFFLQFLPHPPMSEAVANFAGALMASGYVMQVVKTVEVVAGLALLANRFVPLALTLLAPVIVGAFGFHLMLAPEGIGPISFALFLELYLAWSYRAAFAPMLEAHNEPARVSRAPEAQARSHAHA